MKIAMIRADLLWAYIQALPRCGDMISIEEVERKIVELTNDVTSIAPPTFCENCKYWFRLADSEWGDCVTPRLMTTVGEPPLMRAYEYCVFGEEREDETE